MHFPGERRRRMLQGACLAIALAVAPAAARPPAPRVVSLAPHITELVYAAGAGHTLVATVISSDFPPEAQALPRVGDGLNLDPERLLATGANRVLAWQAGAGAAAIAGRLAPFGIRMQFVEPASLDGIADAVETLGAQLGTPDKSRHAATVLREETAALRARYAHQDPVQVFIEMEGHPLYTLGNDPLMNDVLAACGAKNLFADSPVAAPQLSPESLVARQPDVIILGTDDPVRVAAAKERWQSIGIRAAQHGLVFGMNPDTLFRPGPRLVPATGQLCAHVDAARAHLP